VLLSITEPDALVAAGERALDMLTAEFDELLARMQTPGARKGMADAFNATPAIRLALAGQTSSAHHETTSR
jgi:hypothetical protein